MGFECYQFRNFDRSLTTAERKEISSWSSRTSASSVGATFSYSYGGFPKEEERTVLNYFDAMLFFDSYATKQLILKFPEDVVDFSAMLQYEQGRYEKYLSVKRKKGYILVEMFWSSEEGGGWAEEDDYDVGDFQSIRDGIIRGDYRGLYLFWLSVAAHRVKLQGKKSNFFEHEDDYDKQDDLSPPPIPPNLGRLDASLQALIDLFEIDQDLITAAQGFSNSQQVKQVDYPTLLKELSEEERLQFLRRLLEGEGMLDTRLRKRLDQLVPEGQQVIRDAPSIDDILDTVGAARDKREQREAKAATIAHKAKMEKIRREEATYWKTVFFNLERKAGKSYDHATTALRDLQDAAEFFDTLDKFSPKMKDIREKYGRSRTLIQRFDKAKLVK